MPAQALRACALLALAAVLAVATDTGAGAEEAPSCPDPIICPVRRAAARRSPRWACSVGGLVQVVGCLLDPATDPPACMTSDSGTLCRAGYFSFSGGCFREQQARAPTRP